MSVQNRIRHGSNTYEAGAIAKQFVSHLLLNNGPFSFPSVPYNLVGPSSD